MSQKAKGKQHTVECIDQGICDNVEISNLDIDCKDVCYGICEFIPMVLCKATFIFHYIEKPSLEVLYWPGIARDVK